jgi:Fe-S-cluster-containing dehydrogenase component
MGARVFGDLNDPESAVSQILAHQHTHALREDLGTHPRVFYLHPFRVIEEAASHEA